MLQKWLQDGMKESTEQISEFIACYLLWHQ